MITPTPTPGDTLERLLRTAKVHGYCGAACRLETIADRVTNAGRTIHVCCAEHGVKSVVVGGAL